MPDDEYRQLEKIENLKPFRRGTLVRGTSLRGPFQIRGLVSRPPQPEMLSKFSGVFSEGDREVAFNYEQSGTYKSLTAALIRNRFGELDVIIFGFR